MGPMVWSTDKIPGYADPKDHWKTRQAPETSHAHQTRSRSSTTCKLVRQERPRRYLSIPKKTGGGHFTPNK